MSGADKMAATAALPILPYPKIATLINIFLFIAAKLQKNLQICKFLNYFISLGTFFVEFYLHANTILFMKKYALFIFICIAITGYAKDASRSTIDSMQHEIKEFRDSVLQEIRSYKDSIREARYQMVMHTPHSLRIGWGDQMYETLVWRDRGHYTTMPPSYQAPYSENFRYTQHWFAEYLYNFNYWYSLGLTVDYSGVLWDQVLRDGQGTELSRENNKCFHNIAILPTVNFTYFYHSYVSLYSALGLGLNINTGSELDYKNRYTALAPVANITLLGMRVGNHRCYGAIEIGGVFALNAAYEVYMLGSRLFTASIGVRL
jgi:hypothetical protein